MKTLIAAGLAALSLAATSVATADPIHPVEYHHPFHHAVVVRTPIVYVHHHHRRVWGVRFHGPVRHHIA